MRAEVYLIDEITHLMKPDIMHDQGEWNDERGESLMIVPNDTDQFLSLLLRHLFLEVSGKMLKNVDVFPDGGLLNNSGNGHWRWFTRPGKWMSCRWRASCNMGTVNRILKMCSCSFSSRC